MSSVREYGDSTRSVHEAEGPHGLHEPLVPPIYQCTVFEMDEPEAYESYRDTPYLRHNNTPTQTAVARKLAGLERAEDALVTPSGMAAIYVVLSAHLRRGDHLVTFDNLYGGTAKVIADLERRLELKVSRLDIRNPASWRGAITPRTRLIYGETVMNPLLTVCDIEALATLGRGTGIPIAVDNTVATPLGLNPADFGIDFTIHSASKYLNGHSDIVAGVITGSSARLKPLRVAMAEWGVSLDPNSAFLLHRGLRTFALRFRAQSDNACRMAAWLASQPAVRRVHHPSLTPTAPRLATPPALLSFELDCDGPACEAWMRRCTLARVAPSFGGFATTLCRAMASSHASVSAEARKHLGVSDALIRLSVGIEDIDDLIADFETTLAQLPRLAA